MASDGQDPRVQDSDLSLPIGLLDQLASAVALVDADWRIRYVSGPAAQVMARPAAELLGQDLWELFPGAEGTEQQQCVRRAMLGHTTQRTEWHSTELDLWVALLAVPCGAGLLLLLDDVTEQRASARRAARLVELGEALARAVTPSDINRVVTDVGLTLVESAGGTLLLADPPEDPLVAVEWRGPAVAGGWQGIADPEPASDAHHAGAPVLLTSPEELLAVYPGLDDDVRRSGLGALAALPLTSGDRRLGVLLVAFGQPRSLSSGDQHFLATVAAMASQALVRAGLIDVETRSIDALQRSLLPRALATAPGLATAARYVPSNATARIGGDWYDVIALPGGGVALVMGDVEGHDLGAAALMGLVRSAVRAYALDGHAPSVVLSRTNAFLSSLDLSRIVTLSYAQLHPLERLVIAASAGHPLTQVLAPDGDTHEIPSEVGPPLGVFDDGSLWPETTSTLPEGATLVLYTDGLVAQDVEVRSLLAGGAALTPDALADRLLAQRTVRHDDVALLVARLTAPGDAPHRLSRRLPPTPASVPLSRAFARQLMGAWGLAEDTIDGAALIVTELVTNAARHSEDALEVVLELGPEVLRLEVSDTSHRMPVAPSQAVADDATSGRGLLLVEAIASRWGVESEGLSKLVWAELDLAPGQLPGSTSRRIGRT